jgi:4-hydroxybenzoate polyprenyltransferase
VTSSYTGLAFNWGALLGWSAMAGSLTNASSILLPLYCSSICWTIIYDTIYAHQDKTDDVSAGIKSTALLFGDSTKPVLYGFSLGMLSLFQLAVRSLDSSSMLINWNASNFGELIHTGHPFFSISLTLAAVHLVWQIRTVDLNSREDCWTKFRSNIGLGIILWAGLLLDYYFQVVQTAPSSSLYSTSL